MKKLYYPIIFLYVCICKFSTAQILCIYCYNQNDSISTGVNNLLLNGGFENTTCIPGMLNSVFCPNSNNYSCDVADWTCTGGGSLTYSRIENNIFSIIAEGTKASYFGNLYCNACSATPDDTSCLNNIFCTTADMPAGYPVSIFAGYGGTTGISLEQTVSGLTAGNTYILEFWAGGEPGPQLTNDGLFAINVGFGDTLLRDKPAPPVTGIGTRYIIEFNATSSSHTIKFTNWGHFCSSCTELVLDDVRLYTLAELSASVPHCTLGTDDVFASQKIINVFPNPVTNELIVKTNNNELSEIILYDRVSGKLQRQQFINSVSLNTGQLAKGIYIYEVRNKDGSCKKGKVVKD